MRHKTNNSYSKPSDNDTDVRFIVGLPNATEGANEDQSLLLCIDQLTMCLDRNYTNNRIKVDDIAKELGMVERTLRRKSKTIFGLSPTQLLNQYRIFKAKSMLSGQFSITEIAHSVGFSSNSYFTQVFKEVVGVLPQDFRNK